MGTERPEQFMDFTRTKGGFTETACEDRRDFLEPPGEGKAQTSRLGVREPAM